MSEPSELETYEKAAQIINELTADRDQWKARAEAAENGEIPYLREALAEKNARIAELEAALAAEKARAEAAEANVRIANRGGLDLLYAIRKAIGWTDKHALSLLPDECKRLKAASGTKRGQNAPIWPGKGYDNSQPGGFDGPTGAD